MSIWDKIFSKKLPTKVVDFDKELSDIKAVFLEASKKAETMLSAINTQKALKEGMIKSLEGEVHTLSKQAADTSKFINNLKPFV